MMKEALVSIIVPVYNCENFLSKCLDSIIHQKYKNLEIIIVDADDSIEPDMYDFFQKAIGGADLVSSEIICHAVHGNVKRCEPDLLSEGKYHTDGELRFFLNLVVFKNGDICLWVDNNPCGNVQLPDKLLSCDFDYVVIAVQNGVIAMAIQKQIELLNMDDSRILWEKPRNILKEMALS